MPRRHRHVPHPRRADLHTSSGLGDRFAGWVTRFSGSYRFLFLHAVWWGIWIPTGLFGHDRFPFGLLTMILSLEAIVLSTLVLMSQAREAEATKRQSDIEASEVEQDLLLTQEIHHMSGEIHQMVTLLQRIASEQREEHSP